MAAAATPPVGRYRDLIGGTPMVDITALAELQPGMAGKVKVYGKCEFMNPVGAAAGLHGRMHGMGRFVFCCPSSRH